MGTRNRVIRHRRMLILAILSSPPFLSGTTPLRDGWVPVPGAQDLIQAGQWGCVSGVTATAGAITVSANSNYNTVINTSGPLLKVPGDFSVRATLAANPAGSAYLTLVGTLSTGPDWWSGLKRLDVGIGGSNVTVSYWTGSSSNAAAQTMPVPSGTANASDLEVARTGTQIAVFAGGVKVGAFTDPGLFASGQVYLGFNVAPLATLNVTALSAAMPAGGTGTLYAPGLQLATRSAASLRDSAAPSGLLLGAAVDPSHFSSSGYAQTLGREFGLVVAENAMKFAETEPAPHQFNFCAADQIVQYAQLNGMLVRGHNLVWQQDLPAWLTGGNFTAAQASAILKEHIETVMGHFAGQTIDWDVVNEAIAYGSPYGPQPSYWLNQLGSGYVEQAFRWAHAADPNAKLFYNDTGGEGLGAKSDAVYNLVSGLVGRGVPINGVGLQMHVTATPPPASDISTNIARYAALGLEVHITEMDVRVPVDSTGAATPASLAAQANAYQSVLTACQANSNCTALLTWGVTDAYSWIPGSYPGFGSPLLFDSAYNPKPAWTALKSKLDPSAAGPVVGTNGVVIHGGTRTALSPGALADIYGTRLSAATLTTPAFPLATSLGGVHVLVNGRAAPVYYVSPGLVIFQVPYEIAPGPALIQVRNTAGASLSNAVTVESAAPSILTYAANWGVVQHQDGTVNSQSNCAPAGSVVTAYLIGTGPLDHPVATGSQAPLSPLSNETLATTATIGTVNAPVVFAGMTPTMVGLAQVNLQVPNTTGILPLQIRIGTFASNAPSMCVR